MRIAHGAGRLGHGRHELVDGLTAEVLAAHAYEPVRLIHEQHPALGALHHRLGLGGRLPDVPSHLRLNKPMVEVLRNQNKNTNPPK